MFIVHVVILRKGNIQCIAIIVVITTPAAVITTVDITTTKLLEIIPSRAILRALVNQMMKNKFLKTKEVVQEVVVFVKMQLSGNFF